MPPKQGPVVPVVAKTGAAPEKTQMTTAPTEVQATAQVEKTAPTPVTIGVWTMFIVGLACGVAISLLVFFFLWRKRGKER
jgi:hypothetical protein